MTEKKTQILFQELEAPRKQMQLTSFRVDRFLVITSFYRLFRDRNLESGCWKQQEQQRCSAAALLQFPPVVFDQWCLKDKNSIDKGQRLTLPKIQYVDSPSFFSKFL